MRKSVESKENGDQITHMFYNWIVGMCFSSLKCAFCYLKNQYILEAQPLYNPRKDLVPVG